MDTEIAKLIEIALEEDLFQGDVTTDALIIEGQQGTASIQVKGYGVIAGIDVAKHVFLSVDPQLQITVFATDGTAVKPGDIIARIEGPVASILKAERTALNFLQHLSGIASETARYVEAVNGLPVQVTDTRKTLPGLRTLQKFAVIAGGGRNHRMHLGDGFLIKDNHILVLSSGGFGTKEIIDKARKNASPDVKIEIEVQGIKEADEAANAGADIIMLDNMSLDDMRQAVRTVHGRALIEASGGITLDNIREVAETGVDFISIGALTHSVKALDISLDLEYNGQD